MRQHLYIQYKRNREKEMRATQESQAPPYVPSRPLQYRERDAHSHVHDTANPTYYAQKSREIAIADEDVLSTYKSA